VELPEAPIEIHHVHFEAAFARTIPSYLDNMSTVADSIMTVSLIKNYIVNKLSLIGYKLT